RGMVELEDLTEEEDIGTVLGMIRLHRENTGSPVAAYILDTWTERSREFVKIISPAYRRVMELTRSGQIERVMEVVNG
ncbi:MAG TPA: hypothetical protein VMW87_16625, partial [Spirochaetia bacterium]|nr:hypothetical protein [Spirochaetia bacterium]